MTEKPSPKPITGKDVLAVLAGALALFYLANPTAGVFELIPDNLPVVGNLDEAAATAIVLMVLRHFGLDLTGVLGGSRNESGPSPRKASAPEPPAIEAGAEPPAETQA